MAVTNNAATGGADLSEQPPDTLIEAATALLTAVGELGLPLDLPTAEPARRARTEIQHILTAAILPRLRTPNAPLLCALAGPTGVGKSTLLNALAGTTLSATGPLRPTTRTPVLVCHPADMPGPAEAAEATEADAEQAEAEQADALATGAEAAPDGAAAQVPADGAAAESGAEQVDDQAPDVDERQAADPDGESGAAPQVGAPADDNAAAGLSEPMPAGAEAESGAEQLNDQAADADERQAADPDGESGAAPQVGAPADDDAAAGLSEAVPAAKTGQRRENGDPGLSARVGVELGSLLSSPLPSPSLPRGIALVDTVDGDVTVVEAADVVVVVVSAERYADAAVWRVLRRVSGWGTPIVVVLGRVAAGVVEEVSGAFVELLRVNGLGSAPYFVVEEVGEVADGGEGARARDAFPGGSGALAMDGGQGESADIEGGAPGEGGYGDGGLGCAGEPAGGTGSEIEDGDGPAPESESGVMSESGATSESGDGPEAAGSESRDESEAAESAEPESESEFESEFESESESESESEPGIGSSAPLLPTTAVAGLHGWLKDAGADTAGRVRIGMLGVAGRLDSVDKLVGELADAWEGQRLALQVLHQGLERVHTAERVRFRGAVDAGELLGGEVRIRWQELLGSGRVSALFGADDGAGKRRGKRKRAEADWSTRFHNPTGHDVATAPLRAALVEAVARGHRGALERAARKTIDQWELTPGAPEPAQPDEATRRATDPARAAAEWLDHLPTVILDQAHSRRTTRTIGPAGAHIRSAALVLGVAALAGSGTGTRTGTGTGTGSGTETGSDIGTYEDPAAEAAVGLLHTMFGEDADRLRTTASTALKDANARLLDHACRPHRAQLAAYPLDPRQAQALADARAAVARARNEED